MSRPRNMSEIDELIERAKESLERSVIAIDDWLNTYAPELCDEKRVAEARDRIGKGGTLWYIATVQEANLATLAALEAIKHRPNPVGEE